MRVFLFFLIITFYHQLLSQNPTTAASIKQKESFDYVKTGQIKKELSFFTISASFKDEEGDSVYKTPVQEISVYEHASTSATFIQKGVYVKINAAAFDTTGHKFTYLSTDPQFISLIDNKHYWGTDGGIPKNKIESVSVQYGSKTLLLPDSALNNLFEPNFCYKNRSTQKTSCHCGVYLSADKKRLYVYMLNSDGAGGYEVTWIIENGKYVGRVIDYGF